MGATLHEEAGGSVGLRRDILLCRSFHEFLKKLYSSPGSHHGTQEKEKKVKPAEEEGSDHLPASWGNVQHIHGTLY